MYYEHGDLNPLWKEDVSGERCRIKVRWVDEEIWGCHDRCCTQPHERGVVPSNFPWAMLVILLGSTANMKFQFLSDKRISLMKEVLSDSGGDPRISWDVMIDPSPRSMVKDFCPLLDLKYDWNVVISHL